MTFLPHLRPPTAAHRHIQSSLTGIVLCLLLTLFVNPVLAASSPANTSWFKKAQELFCGDDAWFDLSNPYLDTDAMLKEIKAEVPQFEWEQHAKFLRCGIYETNILQFLARGDFDVTNRYFVVTIECLSQFEEANVSSWSSEERIHCTSRKNERHLAKKYEDAPKPLHHSILTLVNEVLDEDGLKLTLLDLVEQIIRDNKNTDPMAMDEWITVKRYLKARGALNYNQVKHL